MMRIFLCAAMLIAAAKQIGFHFNSKKEPLPVVVIDHIDKPTPN